MGSDQIKYIVIGVLTAAFLFVVFFGNSSLKKARKLVDKLETEVDSLSNISGEYKVLQKRYEELNLELEETRNGVMQIRENIRAITQKNIQSNAVIRNKLNGILVQYDSLYFPEVDTTGIDSLIF